MYDKKILIVDDEADLLEALSSMFERTGYQNMLTADNGKSALEVWKKEQPDIIILDVMMPKMDGFAVASALRRKGVSTPVLLLTARDAVADKITGLDSGADDYMTKPFSPAELLAHLRALTRRQGEVVFETLRAGDLELNLESYDLACNAKSIHLSYKEFSICRILLSNPGQVVSKDLLIAKVWGVESSAEDNNVEAYISFLRKKFAFLGSEARIETLRKRVKGALDQKDDRALEDAIADLTQALQAVGRFTDDSASSSEDGAMDASFTSGESGSSQN